MHLKTKKLQFRLHFPPLVKHSSGLPLVPFSWRLGHMMRVTLVSFCQEQNVLHCKQK